MLESSGHVSIGTTIDARKQKIGRDEALSLAQSVERVLVVKGKDLVTFDMNMPPDADILAQALLGPTGHLRAPTLLVDKTLLVGFHENAYRYVLER